MIKSGPKIEERRVIKKELRSMLRLVHSCHVSFLTLIFCKNILNSEYLFCKSFLKGIECLHSKCILLNVNVYGLSLN